MNKKEYAVTNRLWLDGKSKEDGVFSLKNGIFYKILNVGVYKGTSSPSVNSVVTVHYTGKTIDGNVFDSSRKGVAPAFRLRELIPGWIEALTCMRPGDRWEVYIPAEMGYGKYSQPGIPGNSVLIFDIELLNFY